MSAQSLQAMQMANATRCLQVATFRELAAGTLTADEAVRLPHMARRPVALVLSKQRGWGRVTARRALAAAGIRSELRRCGQVTDRQVHMLAVFIARKAATGPSVGRNGNGQAQRDAAMLRANTARVQAAALKREMGAGNLDLADALEDERAGCVTACAIVDALPWYGSAKVPMVLDRAMVPAWLRVRDMTARQRQALAEAVA